MSRRVGLRPADASEPAIGPGAGAAALIGPPAELRAAHISVVQLGDRYRENLALDLKAHKAFVTVRGTKMRITPHVYNEEGDIVRLFELIEKQPLELRCRSATVTRMALRPHLGVENAQPNAAIWNFAALRSSVGKRLRTSFTYHDMFWPPPGSGPSTPPSCWDLHISGVRLPASTDRGLMSGLIAGALGTTPPSDSNKR